jgi:hypothetical protein
MKYYKLLYDYEHDEDAIYLEINEKSFDFDRYDVEKGIVFDTWNADIEVIYDNSKGAIITDYLANDLVWFIVTDKLKNIIESMNNSNIQYLPVKVRGKHGAEELNTYLINICNIVDALDLDNSKYSVHEIDEKEKMISIQKYVIKGDGVEGYDIFRLKDDYVSIFISERLRKAMMKNGVTGCDYLEVKVV